MFDLGSVIPIVAEATGITVEAMRPVLERIRNFTGREWVFDRLHNWVERASPRHFLITGGPGTGKTSIAGVLVARSVAQSPTTHPLLGDGWLAHFHFCQAFNEASLSPLNFVRSFSLALSKKVRGFPEALAKVSDPNITINATANAGDVSGQLNNVVIENLHIGNVPARNAFDQLVRQPLEAIFAAGERTPLFVLVDSLDESLTYGAGDNIAELLGEFCDHPADLPANLHFIFTSRPDRRVEALFGDGDLDLIKDAPPDVDDVRSYASARLRDVAEPKRTLLAERVRDASRGNFLYARYVVDELLSRPKLPDDINELELPEGLKGLYRNFIKRELAKNLENWEERYRPVLGLLAVARAPGLTRQHVAAVSELPASRADAVLNLAQQYLTGDEPNGPFTLYHQSFRDFLVSDPEYQIYPAEADETLGTFFVDTYGEDWSSCEDAYALLHTPAHLMSAVAALKSPLQRKQREKIRSALTDVLGDLNYLQARLIVESGSTLRLEQDLAHAQALLEDGPTTDWLGNLADALRREGHVVRSRPEMLYVQLHNRFYRGDGSDADLQLERSRERRNGNPWIRARHCLPIEVAQKAVIDLRPIAGMKDHEGSPTVESVVLCDGDRKLATGSGDGVARLWDLESNSLLATLKPPPETNTDDSDYETIQRISASRDGKRFLILQAGGTLTLWSESLDNALNAWPEPVLDALLVPDARHAIVLTKKKAVELWELETYTLVRRWLNLKPRAFRISMAADDGLVLVAGTQTVWVWKPLASMPTDKIDISIDDQPGFLRPLGSKQKRQRSTPDDSSEDDIGAIGLSEDGRLLAIARDGQVSLTEMNTGKEIWSVTADSTLVRAVAVSNAAGFVFSGGVDTRLKLWSVGDGALQRQLRGHTGHIMDIAVSRDARHVVTGDGAGTIRVWDLATARVISDSPGHQDQVNEVVFSANGTLALSASEDGHVLLWDVTRGAVIQNWKSSAERVTSISFAGPGRFLAGCSDGMVTIWESDRQNPVRSVHGFGAETEEVDIVAVSPMGKHYFVVASGEYAGAGGSVWRCDGENTKLWQSEQNRVSVAAFAQSGRIAVVDDDILRIWDIDNNGELRAIVMPEEDQHLDTDRISLAANGRWLVSGDINGGIRVWNLSQLNSSMLPAEHLNYVHAVALSSDGRFLLSGGWDGVLRFWDVATQRVLARYDWGLPLECCALHQDPSHLHAIVGDKQGNVLFFTIG